MEWARDGFNVMNQEVDMLPNRLNYDPVIFKGCSLPEFLLVTGICLSVTCFALGIIGHILLGNFIYGVALGFIVGGGLVYLMCGYLQRLRRDQEIGYLMQCLHSMCYQKGLSLGADIIRRSGVWMAGRDAS